MRDFLKYTLASCLGVSIALIILTLLGFLGVASFISFAASANGDQVELPSAGVLELKLGDIVPEKTNNAQMTSFSFENEDLLGLQDMIKLVKIAKEDDRIEGIYINMESSSLNRASSSSVRRALKDFKESGKFVYAYSLVYGQSNYHLASVADSVFMNPNGMMDFRGFGVTLPFLKNFLNKLGLESQVFYAGDFKGATEPLRRMDLSEENRLQIKEYLRDLYDVYLQEISSDRNISVTELEAIADEFKIRQAKDAVRLGLVDALLYEDEFIHQIRLRANKDSSEKVDLISLSKYYSKKKSSLRYDEGDLEVAVVYLEGSIVGQPDQPGSISEDKYMKIFKKIREDDENKAVVLRINSGGGSAIVSDNLSREIQLIKDQGIPVVCSMGDYAASGGYYLAAPADVIFAEPNTLTGSIGVFAVIPSAEKLMNDYLEIEFDSVGTGPYATSFSGTLALSEEEAQYFQSSVDSTYSQFLQHVAKNRSMTVEQVHEIAQGRVWSGMDAQKIGLVDSLGGLEQAIEEAVAMAELGTEYEIKEFPRLQNPLQQFIQELSGNEGSKPKLKAELEQWLAEEFPQYQLKLQLEEMKGLQMRLPFQLNENNQQSKLYSIH